MFFEQLNKICEIRGVKITPLILSLGMSTGNINKWRNGVFPNGETLLKLANKLDCSVEFLLGHTDDPTPVDAKKDASTETPIAPEIQKLLDAVKGLSREQAINVLQYIRFLKSQDT